MADNRDVHTEHCCIKHGCKYGNDDCTVTTRLKKQSGHCESCWWYNDPFDEEDEEVESSTRGGNVAFEWGRKQEFKNGDRVVIYKTGNDRDYHGTIRGKSFENYIDSYIVELDTESKAALQNLDGTSPYKWDCISITEACLKRPGE